MHSSNPLIMKSKLLITLAAIAVATTLGVSVALRPKLTAEVPAPVLAAVTEPTPHAVSTQAQSTLAGRQLVTTYCISCHANKDTQTEQQKAVAPPLWAIRTRYLQQFPERAAFVETMVSFLIKPDAAKSHMPGAIEKFGIMTPQPFPRELLESAANTIFEADGFSAPAWWADHQQSGRGPRP